MPSNIKTISTTEFITLIALLMSIVAISIDAFLPALGIISQEIPLAHPNQIQYLISALFLGMAVGQLICGPVSDATGRKPILYLGIGLFLFGSLVCWSAHSLTGLIAGRLLMGLGIAGPYVSAMSIVRDKYHGDQMGKIMSFVMLIFIAVPAIAPSLGQGILWLADWRSIFIFYIFYGLLIGTWLWLRLEETLPPTNRIRFSLGGFSEGFKTVLTHRATLSYTLSMGLFFGSFIGYLNSSQQIFQGLFHTGQLFTLYFGGLALVFGLASLCNSQWVIRLGMQRICNAAIASVVISSLLFLIIQWLVVIQLWMFLIYAASLFFCFGLLFGNINAMAMEPMGHVAGIASAVIGAVSSMISMVLGTAIGQLYNNSLMPITLGFLVLGALAWLMIWQAQRPAN